MQTRMLSDEELTKRLNLYIEMTEAYKSLDKLEACLPKAPPPQLVVDWQAEQYGDAMNAVLRVITERWPQLRYAATFWARERVKKAEAAVRAFETGEEV